MACTHIYGKVSFVLTAGKKARLDVITVGHCTNSF